jgi:hypothetical protein
LSVIVQTLKEKLGPSCQAAFIGVPVHPSASQKQVSDTLRGMSLSVEDEFRCPKSGYSIDIISMPEVWLLDCGCTTCVSMQSAAQGRLRQDGLWSSTGPLII